MLVFRVQHRVRQLRNFQSDVPDKSSTHLRLTAITILLTVLPMLRFTSTPFPSGSHTSVLCIYDLFLFWKQKSKFSYRGLVVLSELTSPSLRNFLFRMTERCSNGCDHLNSDGRYLEEQDTNLLSADGGGRQGLSRDSEQPGWDISSRQQGTWVGKVKNS